MRVFTKPRDRLIALAGVASVYQQLTKDRYVAGLWGSSLATGLSWVKRSHISKASTAATGPRWPTWSWASQDDPVHFMSVSTQPQKVIADPRFKLVDTQLEFSIGRINDFSPVMGGFITVTGCLIDLVVSGPGSFMERGACSYPQNWQEGWEGVCFIDDKRIVLAQHQVTALVIGRKNDHSQHGDCFLLLKPYGKRKSVYVRIGFARVDYGPYMGREGWVDTNDKAALVRAAWRLQTIHLY